MIFVDVYVCKSKMKKASSQIKESAYAIDKIISELMAITRTLGDGWQGSDYESFQQKITKEYQDNLNEFSKRLKEYAVYLENASNAYQKLENIFKDKEIEV